MIQSGKVFVRGKTPAVHYFLKKGDVIIIDTTLENKNLKEKILSYSIPLPSVIFENDDYIIIDKPVGLLVHPTKKNEPFTLVSWLIQKYAAIADVGEHFSRAGIVHRLDQDVSGVMVAVKDNAAYGYFKKIFQERKVKKIYWALVYGAIKQHSGTINIPIGRSKEGKFVAHPTIEKEMKQPSDKTAVTHYTVIEHFKNFSLLHVEIVTGRTHQIRAHLSAVGHPIVGDTIYRHKKKFLHFFSRKIKIINVPRIFLHSYIISFQSPSGERVEYSSPIPRHLTEFMKNLPK